MIQYMVDFCAEFVETIFIKSSHFGLFIPSV